MKTKEIVRDYLDLCWKAYLEVIENINLYPNSTWYMWVKCFLVCRLWMAEDLYSALVSKEYTSKEVQKYVKDDKALFFAMGR